jgi:hypothetical protein
LKIPYGHIRSVTIGVSKPPSLSKTAVHVDLIAPPVVGEESLNIPEVQSPYYFKFEIEQEDLGNFMNALQNRGVSVSVRGLINMH